MVIDFCIGQELERRPRQLPPLGQFSSNSERETCSNQAAPLTHHDVGIGLCATDNVKVALDSAKDSGAHFRRNFSAHGNIFSPFSSQCLSRIKRCLVASRSSAGNCQKRFHVLDPLQGAFDTGAKFLLDKDCGKPAQFEIGREVIAAVPGE